MYIYRDKEIMGITVLLLCHLIDFKSIARLPLYFFYFFFIFFFSQNQTLIRVMRMIRTIILVGES